MQKNIKKDLLNQSPFSRSWCFFVHVKKEESSAKQKQIINCLREASLKDWGFQLEKDADDLYHFQGYVTFRKGKRLKAVAINLGFPCVVSPLLMETIKKFKRTGDMYFLKQATRIEGPFTKDNQKMQVPSTYDSWLKEDNDFQKVIMKRLEKQNDRQILFVYDDKGGVGKTYFVRKYDVLGELTYIPPMDSVEDMTSFACSLMYASNDSMFAKSGLIFAIDLPRGKSIGYYDKESGQRKPTRFGRRLGQFLETLKNGIMYDKRYGAKKLYLHDVKVVVFTNDILPSSDCFELSYDRIDILDCNRFKRLVSYDATKNDEINEFMDNLAKERFSEYGDANVDD